MRSLYTLLFLLCAALWVGCERPDSVFVRVTVKNIPRDAQNLLVSLVHNGKLSNPLSPYTITTRPTYSFGLQTLDVRSGYLVFSVAAARSAASVGSCSPLVASGEAQLAVSSTGIVDVEVVLENHDKPPCILSGDHPPPVLESVTPSQISTVGTGQGIRATEIRLRGWGFEPAMEILIAGLTPGTVTFRSTREVTIRDLGPLPAGSQDLTIRTNYRSVTIPGAIEVFVRQPNLSLIRPDTPLPPEDIIDSAVLDVNADGAADVVVLTAQGDLHTFLTVRQSTPQLVHDPVSLPLAGLGISGPASMVVSDLEKDKKEELLIIAAGGLAILTPSGGALTVRQSEALLGGVDLSVADFDRDGVLDVLRGGTDLSIHLGTAGPSISVTPALYQKYAVESVLAVDLNQDGRMDFVTHSKPGGLAVFTNEQSSFRITQTKSTLGGCGQGIPGHLVLGDFDANGRPDIFVNGSALLFRNNGGVLTPSVLSGLAPCFGGETAVAVDLNQDRILDLLWLVQPSLVSLLGTGLGRFAESEAVMLPVPAPSSVLAVGPRHIPSIDLDGNGLLDLVIRDHVLLLK